MDASKAWVWPREEVAQHIELVVQVADSWAKLKSKGKSQLKAQRVNPSFASSGYEQQMGCLVSLDFTGSHCPAWIACSRLSHLSLPTLVSGPWGGFCEMPSVFLESCSCSFLTQKPLASLPGAQCFPQQALVMSRARQADEPWWNNDPLLTQMSPPERPRWKRPISSPCPVQSEQCKISPCTVLLCVYCSANCLHLLNFCPSHAPL